MDEQLNSSAQASATLIRAGDLAEAQQIAGRYAAQLVRDGAVIWEDEFANLVTTAGKNKMLDNYLAGSSFSQVGPYMGLISSVSYSAIAAGDTMSSHAGWTEAGNANAPTYSGNRKTAAWSAAASGSKALSAALGFTFTGGGTVKGAFLVLDSGALNTVDNTAGTLFSAGLFSGGDRAVLTGDVLNVSYSASL